MNLRVLLFRLGIREGYLLWRKCMAAGMEVLIRAVLWEEVLLWGGVVEDRVRREWVLWGESVRAEVLPVAVAVRVREWDLWGVERADRVQVQRVVRESGADRWEAARKLGVVLV